MGDDVRQCHTPTHTRYRFDLGGLGRIGPELSGKVVVIRKRASGRDSSSYYIYVTWLASWILLWIKAQRMMASRPAGNLEADDEEKGGFCVVDWRKWRVWWVALFEREELSIVRAWGFLRVGTWRGMSGQRYRIQRLPL